MHDLICFSPLRWGTGLQRPQHLMSRAARDRRVWFIEEPVLGAAAPRLHRTRTAEYVDVCVPQLPHGLSPEASAQASMALVEQLVMVEGIDAPVAWLYTPRMLPIVNTLAPRAIVYDCMHPPPPGLPDHALLAVASLVFTGDASLHEALRRRHPSVHLFPSTAATWDQTWAEMEMLLGGLTDLPRLEAQSAR
ncbi:MAG: hypothetical protein Q8P18_32090 [Pseudomonadota bacterium]|nr:hypothetical protein [Pseudomonadota bacterium]